MAPAAQVSLGLLILIALIWAAAMFHMLWRLNKRALGRLDETGGGYPTWVGHSLKTFLGAVTSGKDRGMRRRIVILTLLLALSIAAHSLVVSRV
jgi:hypothetical protein